MPALIPITYICKDCGIPVGRKRNLRCRTCVNKSQIGVRTSPNTEFKKGLTPWNKGIPHTEETRKKIGLGKKGQKWTDTQRQKILSAIPRGENHPNWISDRSKLSKKQERNDSSYREWRIQVYRRDGFVCKINNEDCIGDIVAHHILGWATFPELRYEINNGITLCHAHHPSRRAEEKRLAPLFESLVSVSKV